jgi:hypothetical protein
VRDIVQRENSTAFQNVEGFVHPEVTVDRDSSTGRQLLGSHGETVEAHRGTGLDEDVATVAKVNEVLALGGAKHVSLWRCGLSLRHC